MVIEMMQSIRKCFSLDYSVRIIILKNSHSDVKKVMKKINVLWKNYWHFLYQNIPNWNLKNKNLPKCIFPLYFHSKSLDFIHINKVLRNKYITSKQQNILENDEATFVYNCGSLNPQDDVDMLNFWSRVKRFFPNIIIF